MYISMEPEGETYRQLIELAFEIASEFSFTANRYMLFRGDFFLQRLKTHGIREIDGSSYSSRDEDTLQPGTTIYYYECNESTRKFILNFTKSLYQ